MDRPTTSGPIIGMGLQTHLRTMDSGGDNMSQISQILTQPHKQVVTPLSFKKEIEGFIPPQSFVENKSFIDNTAPGSSNADDGQFSEIEKIRAMIPGDEHEMSSFHML